jgi:hypothetical protein
MMRTNNRIVDWAAPRAVQEQTVDRFKPQPGEPPSGDVVDALNSNVPTSRATPGLPIHCYVEFEAAKLRGSPNGRQWERVGRLTAIYDDHRAKHIFVAGAVVKLQEQQPGHENSWYALETVVPQPKGMAGALRSRRCAPEPGSATATAFSYSSRITRLRAR